MRIVFECRPVLAEFCSRSRHCEVTKNAADYKDANELFVFRLQKCIERWHISEISQNWACSIYECNFRSSDIGRELLKYILHMTS